MKTVRTATEKVRNLRTKHPSWWKPGYDAFCPARPAIPVEKLEQWDPEKRFDSPVYLDDLRSVVFDFVAHDAVLRQRVFGFFARSQGYTGRDVAAFVRKAWRSIRAQQSDSRKRAQREGNRPNVTMAPGVRAGRDGRMLDLTEFYQMQNG